MAALTTLKLGKTMEKKLHSVGICSAEELMEIGSKQAVFASKYNIPILALLFFITWRRQFAVWR